MKFGEYLKEHAVPEWAEMYIQYDTLKGIIRALEEKLVDGETNIADYTSIGSSREVSLTMPSPTDVAGMPQKEVPVRNILRNE